MGNELLIDGMLSGTGIRDIHDGGYIDPRSLGLPDTFVNDLIVWRARYEEGHFASFPEDLVSELDQQGVVLAAEASTALSGRKVGYFSHGRMEKLV